MNPATQLAAKVLPGIGGVLFGSGAYLLIVNASVGAVVLVLVGLCLVGAGVLLRKRLDQESL